MELDQYSTASGHQSVSIGRNYEMQFPAILGPALLGGGGRHLQYGMPTLYVIMFCLCFNFAFQFIFYVAQLLICL
jgi:hypothetical protein